MLSKRNQTQKHTVRFHLYKKYKTNLWQQNSMVTLCKYKVEEKYEESSFCGICNVLFNLGGGHPRKINWQIT